ncbi:hypothetical protein GQ457_09G013820 [Hibiscus cannabinus]
MDSRLLASQSHPNVVMAWISGCRGRFARMAVSLDLRKPLVSKLFINGRLQVVEYESLPTIFFECGKYGHVKDVCPVVNNANAVDTTIFVPPVIDTPSMTNESFGSWMKSRFNPIFEDETAEEMADCPTTIAVESHSEPAAPGLPLPAATDTRGKGKVPVSSNPVKHRSPTSVRKPLVVQRPYDASSFKSGPSPSRRNSSLSNTRFTSFPRPPTRLNKSNHSAVVVSESDDPVILTDSSTPMRVRDSSVAPLVPNTLLGAVKPPNLVEGHVQSLVQPVIVAESQNAPSLRPLERRNSNFHINLEHELQLELENLLDQEELIWRQKSRIDWISQGDRNTSYLHRKAKQRKIRNCIVSLQLPDGSWCDDEQILRTQAASFFRSLFSDPEVSSGSYRFGLLSVHAPTLYGFPCCVATLTFDDLLRHDRQWDVDRLSALLLPDAIPFVIGIPPPSVNATDALSWNLTPTVARSSDVDRVLVQSDCSHATKLLITALQPGHGILQQDHDLSLVRTIVLLCQDDWHVDFQWIPRELNMVADCLAKLSSPSQFNLLVTTVIPEQVRSLFDRDREGPPYIRHSRGVT